MSKLINQVRVGVTLACVAVLVGCEWTGSGDSDSWNSEFSWINFSGIYRSAGGGPLVSAFSTTSGNPITIGGTNFVNVKNEPIGEGNGVNTTFSGVLGFTPLFIGSLSISAGGVDLVDNGDGTLTGFNSNGAIDYGTGAWSIDLNGGPLGNGVDITADYTYAQSSGGSGGVGGTSTKGNSGNAIISFTVFQTGNKIEITDNNGAKYRGRLGNVATSGGLSGDTDITVSGDGGQVGEVLSQTLNTQPSIGDTAIAEYTAEGTSAAGVHVMMTGTFQGTVARGTGTALFFTDRRMLGVWVESKGVTGDIIGMASPIGVNAPTAEAPEEQPDFFILF